MEKASAALTTLSQWWRAGGRTQQGRAAAEAKLQQGGKRVRLEGRDANGKCAAGSGGNPDNALNSDKHCGYSAARPLPLPSQQQSGGGRGTRAARSAPQKPVTASSRAISAGDLLRPRKAAPISPLLDSDDKPRRTCVGLPSFLTVPFRRKERRRSAADLGSAGKDSGLLTDTEHPPNMNDDRVRLRRSSLTRQDELHFAPSPRGGNSASRLQHKANSTTSIVCASNKTAIYTAAAVPQAQSGAAPSVTVTSARDSADQNSSVTICVSQMSVDSAIGDDNPMSTGANSTIVNAARMRLGGANLAGLCERPPFARDGSLHLGGEPATRSQSSRLLAPAPCALQRSASTDAHRSRRARMQRRLTNTDELRSSPAQAYTLCTECHKELMCTCCKNCKHTAKFDLAQWTNKSRLLTAAFSTVTSATGLPTVVAEPSRPRSSYFWKQSNKEDNENTSDVDPQQATTGRQEFTAACDRMKFNLKDIDEDQVLHKTFHTWNFNILDYGLKYKKSVLTRCVYHVFKHSNLFNVFKIDKRKFISFMHQLELAYWDIPYHNRMHATDVLQAVFYLTKHPVPGVVASTSGETTPNEATEGSDAADGGQGVDDNQCQLRPLANAMSHLELLALFTAAAMHDVDHPGRTNAFLVAAEDSKNHHAATAWSMLTNKDNFFIDQLDATEIKRLRYLILDLILATDLKRHFEIIMDFNAKVKSDDGLNLEEEADRLLTFEMVTKMADINSPAKPFDLHIKWTERILEEFYLQGDAERRLGMPVSPYMDRSQPNVAKLQHSFIENMVSPLATALAEAGLLPTAAAVNGLNVDGNGDARDDNELPEVVANLEQNLVAWRAQIEPQDDENSQQENAQIGRQESQASHSEMATIVENEEEATVTDV